MDIKFRITTDMKKSLFVLFLCFFTILNYSQENNQSSGMVFNTQRFPVFPNCENLEAQALESCFYKEVQDFVFQNFVVPEDLMQNKFSGNVKVLFEVDVNGTFKVIYVNAVDEKLIVETKRVFAKFPKITPSTYNGKPEYSKYNITIAIPLKSTETLAAENLAKADILRNTTKQLTELDSVVYRKYKNPEFESHLNIPFSHSYYAQFDASINQLEVIIIRLQNLLLMPKLVNIIILNKKTKSLRKKLLVGGLGNCGMKTQ